MKIGGLQIPSLIEYPDHLSAIIWTIGCNLRCPFCYNPELVFGFFDRISEKKVSDELEKRIDIIEAVSITGGEPTIQGDLRDYIESLKERGLLVKIDTNGTKPEVLDDLIEHDLIDYVAMDVKTSPDKYNLLRNPAISPSTIKESIKIIKNSDIEYEFRTTVVPGIVMKEDIINIAEMISPAKRYYLQQFEENRTHLSPIYNSVEPYTKSELRDMLKSIEDKNIHADLREY